MACKRIVRVAASESLVAMTDIRKCCSQLSSKNGEGWFVEHDCLLQAAWRWNDLKFLHMEAGCWSRQKTSLEPAMRVASTRPKKSCGVRPRSRARMHDDVEEWPLLMILQPAVTTIWFWPIKIDLSTDQPFWVLHWIRSAVYIQLTTCTLLGRTISIVKYIVEGDRAWLSDCNEVQDNSNFRSIYTSWTMQTEGRVKSKQSKGSGDLW